MLTVKRKTLMLFLDGLWVLILSAAVFLLVEIGLLVWSNRR